MKRNRITVPDHFSHTHRTNTLRHTTGVRAPKLYAEGFQYFAHTLPNDTKTNHTDSASIQAHRPQIRKAGPDPSVFVGSHLHRTHFPQTPNQHRNRYIHDSVASGLG